MILPMGFKTRMGHPLDKRASYSPAGSAERIDDFRTCPVYEVILNDPNSSGGSRISHSGEREFSEPNFADHGGTASLCNL